MVNSGGETDAETRTGWSLQGSPASVICGYHNMWICRDNIHVRHDSQVRNRLVMGNNKGE